MKYQRLTREERYQIAALLRSGLSIRSVAKSMNRSPATISRELRRNRTGKSYRAAAAHNTAYRRRQIVHPPFKIVGPLRFKVISYLNIQWSPEQISGYLRKSHIYISHEAIYQFIFRESLKGSKLYQNCRRNRKFRRSRQGTRNYKNKGLNISFPSIEDRPKIVDQRIRLGDLERDSIVGRRSNAGLLTIVDRVSRVTKIGKMKRVNSACTHALTVKLLKGQKIETITNDNGMEFRVYKNTERALRTKVYFNHPYSSWERGTNENTNGLIRQYFPKGTDFSKVNEKEIKAVERLLNNRPRKIFGYRTPIEVHKELSQNVALSK